MIHAVYYCTSREDVSGLMRLANCKQQLDTVLYTFTLYHVGWMFDPKNFEILKPNTAINNGCCADSGPGRFDRLTRIYNSAVESLSHLVLFSLHTVLVPDPCQVYQGPGNRWYGSIWWPRWWPCTGWCWCDGMAPCAACFHSPLSAPLFLSWTLVFMSSVAPFYSLSSLSLPLHSRWHQIMCIITLPDTCKKKKKETVW